ncbi:MAG: diacylglycerol kinase family lipid kinase [Ruminococcus sp.]|nr:diacylglycerol kinase family lipid kinase [Ruminococcus sp.]
MKHLFILNAFAGKKSSVEELKKKIASLKLEGECIVKVTKEAGDAKRIAKEYISSTDDFVRVYACGGDGTANEAMSGMVGLPNCALGVIPVGTGNDFVKSFDYNADDFRDLEKMSRGEVRTIDLLECSGHYAINTISVGYDCAVAKQAQKIKRFPFMTGPTAYKIALLYCLFSKRRHTFKPYADDVLINLPQGYKTQMMCIAGNGKFYGGGFKATPLADFNDGNIDFVSVPTISVLRFATLVGIFSKGEHIGHKRAGFITHKKCKKLQFKNEKSIDIGLDGEIFNMKDPIITVVPSALKVIIPEVVKEGCHKECTVLRD